MMNILNANPFIQKVIIGFIFIAGVDHPAAAHLPVHHPPLVEGLEARCRRHALAGRAVRAAAKAMGMELLAEEDSGSQVREATRGGWQPVRGTGLPDS